MSLMPGNLFLSVFHSDTCEYQSPCLLRLLIKSRLFLTVLETDKFKLKGQTDRLSGKDPLCHRQHFLGGSSHGRGVSKFFQVSLVGHWTCLWGFLCYGSSILPLRCNLLILWPWLVGSTIWLREETNIQTLAVTTAYLFWMPPPLGAWEGGKVKLFCFKRKKIWCTWDFCTFQTNKETNQETPKN